MGNSPSSTKAPTFKTVALAPQSPPLVIIDDVDYWTKSTTHLTIKAALGAGPSLTISDASSSEAVRYTTETAPLSNTHVLLTAAGTAVASIVAKKNNEYEVSNGGDGAVAPAVVMTIKAKNGILDVTTPRGVQLRVLPTATSAYVFLGDRASPSAPMVARFVRDGALKTDPLAVEVAQGVDLVAVLALGVVLQIMKGDGNAKAASDTSARAAATNPVVVWG
ncbi:hypothetical protein H9P43_002293 [Blastocladiella emersonii ATCC 22665]|nr:hypothetical protein H9P43_002293 [Blastocladiella emersonii ATCC 22665]